MKMNRGFRRRRFRGISVLEVIACTALVAVMVVPVASVIRESSQSIARASGDASTEARLRTSLRWVSQTIRDSQVLAVQTRRLTLRLPSGNVGHLERRGRGLVLREGTTLTTIDDDIRELRFAGHNRSSSPPALVGVTVAVTANDAQGQPVIVATTVSKPPQV